MRLFVKPEILDTIITGKELQKFGFTTKENLLPIGSVIVSFAAECTLKDLKKRIVLPTDELKKFVKQCRLLLVTFLEKLFERGLTGTTFPKSA